MAKALGSILSNYAKEGDDIVIRKITVKKNKGDDDESEGSVDERS